MTRVLCHVLLPAGASAHTQHAACAMSRAPGACSHAGVVLSRGPECSLLLLGTTCGAAVCQQALAV